MTAQTFLPPARIPVGAARWVWTNLFGSLGNSVLTVIMLWILYRIVSRFVGWAFLSATVAPATIRDCIDNGGACWAFIQAKWRLILFGTFPYDEQWRPALALFLLAALIVASCAPVVWRTRERSRWMGGAWLLGSGLIILLMVGGLVLPRVEIRLWSGLPLTVMLAAFGMVGCFVLSILLALGRRSDMPVVRWVCIVYIEVIRGVPVKSEKCWIFERRS